ncbi:MAG: tRNA preQ1(34) S-adenosylmethionine ribosyltransferase-isomerase QueA [Eubacteriales bacterium]|nr:tRNA preQ1(34) S-adenosylmethionine ribosyltransferase-isomerase QueA [Eubacteriales bacterium]
MHITEFDYNLPEALIAQEPAGKRDLSRLMVLHRASGLIEHKHFYDIIEYLQEGDCLVLNNSKVIPARLFGMKKETGAKVEFLLIKTLPDGRWETMVRPGKRVKEGDVISFSEDKLFQAVVEGYGDEGTRIVRFEYEGIFFERLEEIGKMPLPPYIKRESTQKDKDRYQTVYSLIDGSVAAPTAGLHFTEELLEKAKKKGVKIAEVTLHVGIGTFRPVKCDIIEEHTMHFEEYEITSESAQIINETKSTGGRIICVGTTSCRTIESAAEPYEDDFRVKPGFGSTGIFIYPGYEFKILDSLITNFHLPKSTLLMLISALYNKEDILKAYSIAIDEKYRFFSYGDAMLII